MILGNLGHSLAAPSTDIGNEDERVPDEMDFRFANNPPSTGSAVSESIRSQDSAKEY